MSEKRSRVGLWVTICFVIFAMCINIVNVSLIYGEIKEAQKQLQEYKNNLIQHQEELTRVVDLMSSNHTVKPVVNERDDKLPKDFDTVFIEVTVDKDRYTISSKIYRVLYDGTEGWFDKRTTVQTKAGVDAIFKIHGWTTDWRVQLESNG